MNLININEHTCSKDGLCAAVCPLGLIDFTSGQYPIEIAAAEELCLRCGHCVAVCPSGSLQHAEITAADCTELRKELVVSAEQCEQFLRQRRSIRVYQDKPVPRESLARLIDVARYAPSGHNSQSVQWLVLDNREELHRLAGIVAEWMRWMLANMTDFARAMHMDRAVERWEEGKDIILRDAPALVIAHADTDDRLAPSSCTIALTYLELAATSMHLGCCWTGVLQCCRDNLSAHEGGTGSPHRTPVFWGDDGGIPEASLSASPATHAGGHQLAAMSGR